MATTPFIAPIKNQGGSFYTFTSAKEDFNYSISNPNRKFRFSKFVLLDIPDIKDQSTGINGLGIDKQPGSFLRYDSSDWNTAFAESLQNYLLNAETSIISDSDYDESKSLTVSERIFWKWLKEMGAIRYREAVIGNPEDGGERLRRTEDTALVNDPVTRAEIGKRFVEEDDNTITSGGKLPYNRIVKYIGNIDMVNSVKSSENSYTEIYIYIPTQVGSTPTVLFKSITNDDNYKAGKFYTHRTANRLDEEYINGRSYNDSHPVSMDFRSIFDSDVNAYSAGVEGINNYELSIKKLNEGAYVEGWWYPNSEANTYFTEPTKLSDYRNDKLKISGYRDSVATEKEFFRSRLDGVTLDFDLAKSYSDNLTGAYRTFEEYNASPNAKDFQFNTVLIYYDLIDEETPSNNATNLFGVYFINKMTDTLSGGANMERAIKYKPSKNLSQNGNALAYKINIFLDLNGDNTTIDTFVNEYNNFSMTMFQDALRNMSKANASLVSTMNQINTLKEQVDSLENLVLTSENVAEINSRLAQIETSLDTNKSLYANYDSIVKLIKRNYDEILNIYKNYTSVKMMYDISPFKEGGGIEIDRSVPNKLYFRNSMLGYELADKPVIYFADMSPSADGKFYYYRTPLKYGENYIKVYNLESDRSTPASFNNGQGVSIYIDDTDQKWKKGMKYKISFGSSYSFSGNTPGKFLVRTDAKNLLGDTNGFSKIILELDYVAMNSYGGKPVFEIVCIDPEKFLFEVDF